ncbi:MAG: CotH kinase family protein [Fibrobacter sp.]|nr:CotH kinase family protein [Fibrobacter sp.]
MQHLLVTLAFCLLCCSCVWNDTDEDLDYLVMDDSEYPYAEIPRIVIETEHFQQIRDRETQIPARLQIYGEKGPESGILDLTVRGRGNSSFTGMSKWSIKLKFNKKQEMLGMPKDKEWALIANSADKTLLKNFITYKLAWWLGDEYSPRSEFVELYLNRKYMGVYLLTETVKVSEDRVNIPDSENSYLLELGSTPKEGEIHVITRSGTNFAIKHPKDISDSSKEFLRNKLTHWEYYLHDQNFNADEPVDYWLDVEDYLRYYWIQELSKNIDGAFRRSIFITWAKGEKIKLGPVWDFDMAYGNWEADTLRTVTDWYIKPSGWNERLLTDSVFWQRAVSYWKDHHDFIETLNDSIDVYAKELSPATKNEFKRWPVLENTENWTYKEVYKTYGEAVDSLKSWISQRINWIDKNL